MRMFDEGELFEPGWPAPIFTHEEAALAEAELVKLARELKKINDALREAGLLAADN